MNKKFKKNLIKEIQVNLDNPKYSEWKDYMLTLLEVIESIINKEYFWGHKKVPRWSRKVKKRWIKELSDRWEVAKLDVSDGI